MAPAQKHERKRAAEKLGKLLKTFGATVSEILDDPEVKKKAKEFAESVVDSAAKVAQSKIEDKDIRARFRNVGKAAQTLGNDLEEHFGADKTARGS